MTLTRISGQGLWAIALSVVSLWGCFIGERLIVRNARRETVRVLSELRQLQRKQQIQPVSHPAPRPPHPLRPVAG